jgi:predicted transposase YbfD/YdcC
MAIGQGLRVKDGAISITYTGVLSCDLGRDLLPSSIPRQSRGENMSSREEKKLIQASVMDYLARVPDPRMERTRAHPLVNILVIALVAVLCGADSFTSIEAFGRSKKEFLATLLDLKSGIPSHDTFGRVFAMLEPAAVQEAFRAWVASLVEVTKGEVVAIDGKTLRRSFRDAGNKTFVHMVSAWAANNRVVLGQVKTEEKSNEITAIPKLLDLLRIEGAVVTIDAAGCQKEIAAKIVEGRADYMLAVKDNQPTLLADIQASFAAASDDCQFEKIVDFAETTSTGHGRIEHRRCLTCYNLAAISRRDDWANLACLVLVEVDRTVGTKTSTEQRYYISSQKRLRAKDALATVRNHWGIENGLHWVLDVAFREDDCRVRAGNAAENFAVLRHFTMNLLKNVKSKVGIKTRRLQAGWDHEFLLHVLCGHPV